MRQDTQKKHGHRTRDGRTLLARVNNGLQAVRVLVLLTHTSQTIFCVF